MLRDKREDTASENQGQATLKKKKKKTQGIKIFQKKMAKEKKRDL